VRQIEVSAFKKVQKAVKAQADAEDPVDGGRPPVSAVRERISAAPWPASQEHRP
jgi:hypothetical protein